MPLGERPQHVHLHPRKQRRDHLKRRVLRGRADQQDVPGLHVRQKRVLLRPIEPVHFVHEHDRPAAVSPRALGLGHHFLDFLDSGQHSAERYVFASRALRDDSRQGGFAASRRSPQKHRPELVAFNLRAQRFARAEQLLLSDEFIERLRTHPIGQRTSRLRRFFRLDRAKQTHRLRPALRG